MTEPQATNGASSEQSVGGAVRQVAEHASAVVRLELELAALELKRKIANLGVGIGLAVGAALFALFALGFGLATIAAVLAIFLDVWLALLIVFAGLLLISLVLGLVGMNRIKRGTPPVPEQAIQEAKATQAALRGNGA
ncbi:MAG: phage holin family protein [Thermoleophilia bacterium]|nr:phage holin family protein [Thermoleophilia bacterium]